MTRDEFVIRYRLELEGMSMKRRLTDSQLAERTRANNTKSSRAYRDRLLQQGMQLLAVWIPSELRQQIDTAASLNKRMIYEECTELMREGFKYRELAK